MKVRKYLLALAGLLVSASACYAAFAIFQAALPSGPARTQKNLVSDYGGTCDAQAATRVITLSGAGNRSLAVTVNTFVSGDVGKTIAVPNAASGPSVYSGTIAAFVDAQHITLGSDADIALSSSTQELIWGTDNNAALIAFKAAFQGTTPVQLNLPGNCGYLQPGGGAGKFPFDGIADLIVAGNGAGTSSITSFGGGLLLGTIGQYQDNAHSLRTDTANAGDSCVIAKTQPAVTVSAVSNSSPNPTTFTASATAGVMNVTTTPTGTIKPGAIIGNVNSQQGGFVQVQAYGTGGTTGVGGTGTYALSSSISFALQTTFTAPASYTGDINTSGVLNVTSVEDGTLAVGQVVFGPGSFNGSGGTNNAMTTIQSQIGGTPGGIGTYQLDNRPISAASGKYQSQGVIRVTLNSTTGLTTGDTLYLAGLNGTGQLPQRMNGLKWIKVVNGTQVDLFQWSFDGGYTSGGTGGGDRTSIMPTGSKVLMTGWINQAYWAAPYGYPSNPHWFEYKTVTSTNSGTHQVCFDTPLANAYKSTWPQYHTGSQFEVDAGGPATLYVVPPTWEASIEFKDLTLYVPNGQTTSGGRTITWRDVTMAGVHCAIPTQNVTHNWINVTGSSCSIETDKIVGTWNITNSTVNKVTIQSSAMDLININGITVTNSWLGGPKRLTIANGSFANELRVGTIAYGVADEASCTNCSSALLSRGGDNTKTDELNHPWSMSGGIITIPNAFSASPSQGATETQTRYMVPGHYGFWTGLGGGGTSAQTGRAFKIVDVTQDTVNTYIQTNEAGGFPTGAWTTNGLSVFPHPAPLWTPSNLSGGNTMLAMNGCPSQTPFYSCQNIIYTGGASGGSVEGFFPTVWGVLDTFTFTNNVPYTGAGALGWTVTRFANWQVLKTDLTTTTFGATNMINTKLPSSCGSCTRTLTQSGATNTQSLDSLTAPPTDAWFGGSPSNGPIFTANTPSDSPQVTMTLRTNQNLPP